MTVYTAIYGGRDRLHAPTWHHHAVRIVCYTDDPANSAAGVETIIDHPHNDPARAARWHKTHPPKGDSLWLDGSYQLIADPRPLFASLSAPLGLIRHSCRKCAFKEAAVCARRGQADPLQIQQQVARYRTAGFPARFGLWEGGLILRRADCSSEWQDEWWQEIELGSSRDQVSLPFLLWKFNVPVHTFSKRPGEVVRMYDHAGRRHRKRRKSRAKS